MRLNICPRLESPRRGLLPPAGLTVEFAPRSCFARQCEGNVRVKLGERNRPMLLQHNGLGAVARAPGCQSINQQNHPQACSLNLTYFNRSLHSGDHTA